MRKIQAFGDRLKVKVNGDQSAEARDYLDRMQKAAAIMQFKLEGQLIARNPQWGLDARRLLHRIDHAAGTVKVDGKTWPLYNVLHAGPAAYSSLAVLRDGTIGILYERGDASPYERITFARFPLSSLRRPR